MLTMNSVNNGVSFDENLKYNRFKINKHKHKELA